MSDELYEEDEIEEDEASREAREVQEAADKAYILELRSLLKQAPMRRFIWRLLTECDIGGGFFNGDAEWHLVQDGKRRVGNWALAEMEKADPTVYARILLEQGKATNE